MEQPRPSKPGPPKFLTQSNIFILYRKSQPNQTFLYFLELKQPNKSSLYFYKNTSATKIPYTVSKKTNSTKTWVTQTFGSTKIFCNFSEKPTQPKFLILSWKTRPPDSIWKNR